MRSILFPLITLLSLSALAQPAHTLEPVSLEVKDATLKGTLTLPSSASKVPVALIIAGSGPTDQNGNSLGTLIQPNSYKQIGRASCRERVLNLV